MHSRSIIYLFKNTCVAGFPVSFMYFSRHLVPAFKSRDLSSVHVMTRVKKNVVVVYAIHSK